MAQQEANTSKLSEIELLVISPAQEMAETVQAQLRDAGHNVHASWLNKPQNLGEQMQRANPRLICCHEATGAQDLNRLVGLCINVARGIPVIAVVSKLAPETTASLLQAGASQVISDTDYISMTRALERELECVGLRDAVKQARREIGGLKQQLGQLVAESAEALAYVHDGVHSHLNSAYARLFGFAQPDELEGVPIMDLVAPESRDAVKALLAGVSKKGGESGPLQFVAQRADDSKLGLNMRCRAASMGGEAQLEVLVTQEANALGAPPANAFEGRTALFQTLAEARSAQANSPDLGLLFVCVDATQSLQNRLGLAGSDRVLDELSFFLLDECGDYGQVFRFDVNEFVVLSAADSMQIASAQAEQLRAAIDREIFGDDEVSSPLTVSIAVALLSREEGKEETLIKTMRLAQKTALGEGNSVVVATNKDAELSTRESDRAWRKKIQTSLLQDGFALAYRNIDSLEGDAKPHFDLQLRMLGEHGEIIRPGDFLATAERHGQMAAIDQWVIRQVVGSLQEPGGKAASAVLFVMLTRASIDASEEFLPWLQKMVSELGVDVSHVVASFEEEALQFNTRKATTVLESLREIGFKLAIHDFGASAGSAHLLDLVSADYLRLSDEFTDAIIAAEPDSRVTDTLKSAQDKQIKIIARQVPDATSMARLWQAGVNYVLSSSIQEPTGTQDKNDRNVA